MKGLRAESALDQERASYCRLLEDALQERGQPAAEWRQSISGDQLRPLRRLRPMFLGWQRILTIIFQPA